MREDKEWLLIFVMSFAAVTCCLYMLTGCSFNIPHDITVHCDNCTTPPAQPPPLPPPTPAALTYKSVKNSTLDVYCLKCHVGLSAKGGVDLSTYQSTVTFLIPGDAKDSKICKEVLSHDMPTDRAMPQSNIDDLCKWIDQGAKES